MEEKRVWMQGLEVKNGRIPDGELLGVVGENDGEESAEDGDEEDEEEEDALEAEEGGEEAAAQVALAVHEYPDRLTLTTGEGYI